MKYLSEREKKITYQLKFIEDPGHGWLEVPLDLIKKLNIESKISKGSYKNNKYAYLEEDLDYEIFHEACKKQKFKYFVTKKYEKHCFVRLLQNF